MQFLGSVLNRAILSHLLVAVPPAVVLGWMVIGINRATLLHETQQLHLAIAEQLRDAIENDIGASATLLGQAERILDQSALPIVDRQTMLRAMVADGGIPYLGLYRPDGGFDSLVRIRGAAEVDRAALPEAVRRRLTDVAWTVWHGPTETKVVFVWRRGDEVLGYLGTRLRTEALGRKAGQLVERYLGTGGRVDVLSIDGRYVLSTAGDVTAGSAPSRTPFSMVTLSGRGGLSALEAGVVGEFVDPAGEAQLAAVVSAPRSGWLVAASRPKRVALSSLSRVRLRVALMSVIAALAAGLVGLLMARQISGPVQRLVRAVRRAAQRGFSSDAKVHAAGELGQLASSFNSAIEAMADYRRQLRSTTQLRLRLSRLAPSGVGARDLLARATSAPPGPLEPMTVLYADVVFDDPGAVETEHLVTILGEFFSAAHEATRQEGGRVDRYSGDAMIGLFMASELEDPARSALSAARTIIADAGAIAERWSALSRLGLSASAGIATGRAQLVPDDDPSGDPTVQGDLVEQAAELQQRAEAGQVLVDPATERLADLGGRSVDLGDGRGYLWVPPD